MIITIQNKTRVLALSLIMLLTAMASFSQSDEDVLKHVDSLALKMFVDMNNRDYDAILEMTHPKVFEMVPKESLKDLFKTMFEGSEEFAIEIPQTIPDYKLSKVFTNDQDALKYVFVSYDMEMDMTFHNQEFDDEAKKLMVTMMSEKGMDITFKSNNSLDVIMNDRITIILKDNTTNEKWVMVNYDAGSPLFYQIVPASLLESAKTYSQNLLLQRKASETED